MRVEIAKLHKDLGTTMVYVTHDQVEAMTMADKIVVLRAGRVEQVGTPLDLYNRPANRFVAGFIGSPKMNFLTLAGSPVPVPPGAVTLGVRPEHLSIADEKGGGRLALGRARVQLVEQLGGSTLVYSVLSDGQPVTLALEGQRPVPADAEMEIAADPSLCHLFDGEGRTLALRA
jgi:multiple sugar transport system ATP-binding protein